MAASITAMQDHEKIQMPASSSLLDPAKENSDTHVNMDKITIDNLHTELYRLPTWTWKKTSWA